jgi:lipoprotein-anchoring transpeptidase ErfK/SrfK
MADYYDALKNAVTNLKPANQQARFAFYNRARKMILEQLQSVDPPMADADLRAQLNAFDVAIRQIEKEIARPARQPPTQPHARPQAQIQPEPDARSEPAVDEAPVADEEVGEEAQPPEPRAAVLWKYGIPIGIAAALLVVVGGGYAFWAGKSEQPVAVKSNPSPSVASAPQIAQPVKKADTNDPSADNLPYMLRRQLVYYRTVQPEGTIVLAKSQHFLYVVKPNSSAVRYTFGMGTDCMDLMGLYPVSRKEGEGDARMLYLGDTKCHFRQAATLRTIGQTSSSPGVQFAKDDLADLYDRISPGTRIVVTN